MPLTLGNDLTGLVSREVDSATTRTTGLGKSLTTGDNEFVEVVDGFLGNALRDGEIILGAIARNTAYSINLMTIADEYLTTIASSLQDGLATIGTAGPLSLDKLAVLQKNLDDKKLQANLLISTAKFDGKNLLAGGAKSIDVQVGINATDKLNIRVNDLSAGKLFRSTITNALNGWIKSQANPLGVTTYYGANQAALYQADVLNNNNLFYKAMTNNEGNAGGNGIMTSAQFGAAIFALSAEQKALLDQLAPVSSAALVATGGFAGSNNGQIAAIVNVGGGNVDVVGNGNNNVDELAALFRDNGATVISTGNATSRIRAQDVMQGALTQIRAEQANVSNQRTNVAESADALRASTNVTQAAADSYLKTDYVLTAQQYSEEIRKVVASITSLQAANKIPEAAQRLIDALAR
ncbi:MAG: hypothetical protein J0L79_01175 [Rickettsiales bacterium]|nr:hypothetical protein [Rickettsiales bacterium]